MRMFLGLIPLAAVAVVVLAPVQDAAGQEEPGSQTVTATGEIERPEITTYMYGTHAITDEASNTRYALRSEEEGLLDRYAGQQVTVHGEPVPGYEDGAIEGGPPLLEVTRVEPAGQTNPEPGVDLNEDDVVDEADSKLAAEISDTAWEASQKAGQRVLPPTGGFPVQPLGAGLLLLAAALLARLALR